MSTIKEKCNVHYINNFIYITFNDLIQEGDFYAMFIDDNWKIMNPVYDRKEADRCNNHPSISKICKKIIATTDKSLTVDSRIGIKGSFCQKPLPEPSQQFIKHYIEQYNQGNIIEEVLVEYEDAMWFNNGKAWQPFPDYKTTTRKSKSPKINLKDNTITIRSARNSWNREEVEKLKDLSIALSKHFDYIWNETDIRFDQSLEIAISEDQQRLHKWIEENL